MERHRSETRLAPGRDDEVQVSAKRILFIHQNFPGQFPHIAEAVLKQGHKVAAIGGPTAKGVPGVNLYRWTMNRGSTVGIFDPATRAEADLMRSYAAADAAMALKADGFTPDLIIGHPGWGETLQMSEVFPDARQIVFGEFFYRSHGADVGFDPEFEQHTPAADMRVHSKNVGGALACAMADVVVSPTPFQAWTYPKGLQDRIRIFHEGVDTKRARRKSGVTLRLPSGKVLDGSTPVITFINRNFERLRGFHIFMRALPAFLERCPTAQVLIIGKDSNSGYGGVLPGGETWKGRMLKEVGDRLDLSRVHFTGPLPHSDMISALSLSWAHVYYTYPFVLSWSLVEAMACECLILGSDTAPVRDAITNQVNGVLNDFFDVEALSGAMIQACETPEAFAALRPAAKETALRLFDRETVGVPAWMALIDEMLAGR
ncbi:MAG: group 1 glycosyl transferase [Sphingomonadales bacterium 32-67-7]|nr:MAG: group 1 glycosyl transferase [Sphingomonadales bacterium 32-67-7]